jgi:hypothetical protein
VSFSYLTDTEAAQLQERLRQFEIDQPEPLSLVPSIALRQVVQDIRHVTARGAEINMDDWGSINGSCTVCCAGATLLARGYYRKHMAHTQERARIVRSDERVPLVQSGLWSINREANMIADSFNHVRRGDYRWFLQYFCIVPPDTVDRLINGIATRNLAACYSGMLDGVEVKRMCENLDAVADYLASEGH